MKKKFKVLSFILLFSLTLGCISSYAQSIYTNEYIDGTETEISMKLNKRVFKLSKEAILVNEDSIIDAISATPLAYAKDAPIIATKWKKIGTKTMEYIQDLGVEKITIIGGLKAISKTTEMKLLEMGIDVERIYGSNRYETSIEIAKEIDKIKKISNIFLVSSSSGIENSLSIYSYAAQNNMPIIWNTNDNFTEIKEFIKLYDVECVYAIGSSEKFISEAENNIENVQILKEINKLDTSIPFINQMQKGKIDSIYTTNIEYGSRSIANDYISLGVVSAKQNIPILVCTEAFTYNQDKFLKNNKINKVIQVGDVVDEYSIIHTITTRSFISAITLILLLLIITIRAFRYEA